MEDRHIDCGGEVESTEDGFRCKTCAQVGTHFKYSINKEVILFNDSAGVIEPVDNYSPSEREDLQQEKIRSIFRECYVISLGKAFGFQPQHVRDLTLIDTYNEYFETTWKRLLDNKTVYSELSIMPENEMREAMLNWLDNKKT